MATRTVPLERDVQKAITDYLDAERIPYFRMNSGDRFGSYNGKKWRIKGHGAGTADLLVSPKITKEFPFTCADFRGMRVPVFLFVEVKRPGGKQSPEQCRFELECLQRGHAYLVADDVDTVAEWLKERGAL